MSLVFWISLLAIGLTSLLGAAAVSAVTRLRPMAPLRNPKFADSLLEQSGFELAVPGHVECIATVTDWASLWVGDEETSIKETALSLSGQANGGANDLETRPRGTRSKPPPS